VGRGNRNKTNMINYCPKRAVREESFIFASRFLKPPGCSEFSGAHLDKHQSNLIFQSADFVSWKSDFFTTPAFGHPKKHEALSKMDISVAARPK